MAANTFGVTPALLEERRLAALGIATSGKTGSDVAQGAIDEIAGDVDVELRAAQVDPTTITQADSPVAWGWLQSTILYGAASLYGRSSTGGAEVFESYAEEYRKRMGRLRSEPFVLLVDLPTPPVASGAVSIFR